MKLACAVRICSKRAYVESLDLARVLFTEYIEGYIDLYGTDSVTSNIRHLSHIVDDVETLGDLSTINAYEFENALYHMKMVLKQCNRPLEQLARRISENEKLQVPFSFDFITPYIFLLIQHL